MAITIALLSKSETTKTALKRLISLVHAQVIFHVAKLLERRVTNVAH
jgi:hypothetical protein